MKPVQQILTHGDCDGIISAASVKTANSDAKVVFTQPFLLHKLPDLTEDTILMDLAVDQRNPQASIDWATRNKEKIVLWVDHHEGGEALLEILGEKFIFDLSFPSCPALLAEKGLFDVPQVWVNAANAGDRPNEFEPTALSTRINSAFKVALVELQDGNREAVNEVNAAIVEELVSGQSSELVNEKVAGYQPLLDATQRAANKLQAVDQCEKIAVTQLGQEKVDKTALFMAGYKKAPVVVLQYLSLESEEPVSLVATSLKSVNLVKAFGFQSGAPFRVTLGPVQAETHEAQLALVVEKLGSLL